MAVLGSTVRHPIDHVEVFPAPSHVTMVRFTSDEVSSICPVTSQPDLAKIVIEYGPDQFCIESKSLKLYLFSFRNHGDFHEDCVQTICDDIVDLIKPLFIEVEGEFTPRGGIAIYPYASFADKNARFQKLHDERLMNYAPGKYSMDLSKLY